MVQALFAIAIHYHIRNLLVHGIFKPVAQHSIVERALLKLFTRESGRFTKSHDSRNVFRAGTSLTFLVSADVLPVQSHTAPDIERANPFRRIHLVPRHRQQIATTLLDIQTQSSSSLHRISMKPEMPLPGSPPFTNKRTNFGDWLDRSDLLVR